MIHIKYKNKWEKQERLESFPDIISFNKWYEHNKYIKIYDYAETPSLENPFQVWKKYDTLYYVKWDTTDGTVSTYLDSTYTTSLTNYAMNWYTND